MCQCLISRNCGWACIKVCYYHIASFSPFASNYNCSFLISAYWTSDKIEYQTELARTLSDIIFVSEYPAITLKFIKAYFFIMNREWLNIDHYRMDKFYKLLRQMLFKSLDYLAKMKWDLTIVNAFSKLIIEEEIIRPEEPIPSDIFRFTQDIILPHLWDSHKNVSP